jgi:Ran GTPase-activating protein (RanGAP) involved in mRNA processing and transport
MNETQATTEIKGHALRLQRLMRSISQCKQLEILWLWEIKIGYELMKEICEMIDSLVNLRELNLFVNDLSSSALSSLANFLQEKRRRLQVLDIGNNKGNKDEDAVRQLQQYCNVVYYD